LVAEQSRVGLLDEGRAVKAYDRTFDGRSLVAFFHSSSLQRKRRQNFRRAVTRGSKLSQLLHRLNLRNVSLRIQAV
jgi:hypothetical protein